MKKIMKKIIKTKDNEKDNEKEEKREEKSPRPVWPTYGVRWAGGPPALASSTARADDVFRLKQKINY
jgi:hypothetical protein